MKSVKVNAGKGYDIYIENNILNKTGELIRSVSVAKTVCLVSDTNVFPLYGSLVKEQLQSAGFTVVEYIYPAGEASKKMSTVMEIVERMAAYAMTRKDLVVALGGGVCGDMAGFAAAIYLRGIDFVQLPTSLLAQVDSSVGGKTAVDLPQGKNLCGAFHQPALVLIDPNTLNTLSPHFFADGMAEAIKTGCIKSRELFEKTAAEDARAQIEDIIYDCVRIKAGVVERDEKEHGERALLNFGHTAGHAIEKLHGFETVSHGEAVGIGMVLISRAAERLSLTEPGTADAIAGVLKKYSLPVEDTHSLAEIAQAMNSDKKRTGSAISFVLLEKIGKGYIYPVKNEKIPEFLNISL